MGEVYGGIVWGIGAALTEASEVDPRFGGFLNNNIAEYQVPVNADVRQCEIRFIDREDPLFNSLGAKGLGEERAYPISTKVNSVKNDDAG